LDLSLIAYYCKNWDVEDILNWDYYKKSLMVACMSYNREEWRDEQIALNPYNEKN
jgi:hypothetical protein